MNLAQIQTLFWRAITWPTGVQDFLAQADASTRSAFERVFAQSEAFARAERMQVYAEAYFYRLLEVLQDQFEVTAWVLGPRRFHNLVTDYVLEHPSTDPDVRRFGRSFPQWLARHAQGRAVPGLPELAAVEWAIVRAIDAKDEQALRSDALGAIEVTRWPRLRFVATGTTALLPCPLPFCKLFSACKDGQPSPEPPPAAHAPTESAVLVRREGFDVYQRRVAPPEARALRVMLCGRTFAEICETSGDAAQVARWLRQWLQAGLIARCSDD